MEINWELPTSIIDKVIGVIKANNTEVFSTIEFIETWERVDKKTMDEFEKLRGRNWRAIVGKAIKKYSIDTNKFRQITPPQVSPARWRFEK
ncbi:MAG: hypothetical protein WAT71_04000 [Ignavibacteria bacterium]